MGQFAGSHEGPPIGAIQGAAPKPLAVERMKTAGIDGAPRRLVGKAQRRADEQSNASPNTPGDKTRKTPTHRCNQTIVAG
jgi:hypothetical protein